MTSATDVNFNKGADTVRSMFGTIASRYDVTNSVLSFGIHHIWKYKVAAQLPSGPLTVLDLCTGTGDLLPKLKSKYAKVIGGDFCYPMLARGQLRFGSTYPLTQADALNLPFKSESFDLVTIAFGVRNFENLEKGLSEIKRILKKDGHIVVLEFGQPRGILFGPLYQFYSKYIMPTIGGILTGNKRAYEYLPSTAATFPSGESFQEVLKHVGFNNLKLTKLSFGIAYIYLAKVV